MLRHSMLRTETIRLRELAKYYKMRKPGKVEQCIIIEEAINGAFTQSASCKTTQRVLAPDVQQNFNRLK